jgi:threonine/homoserine/homoserine lactone efflux protein
MNPTELFGLSLVLLTAAALPTLSTLLVISNTMLHGVRSGTSTAVGVVLGDLFWLSLSLSGLAAAYPLLVRHWFLIKLIAAIGLIYLAMRLCLHKQETPVRSEYDGVQSGRGWLAGFILTLTDLKAVLFYLSILPAFVDLANLSSAEIMTIVSVTVFSVGVSKLFYVLMTARLRATLNLKHMKFLRWTAAFLFLLIATSLLIQN